MEFPKWKKKILSGFTSMKGFVNKSKVALLGATVVLMPQGQEAANHPEINPAEPGIQISKYSKKFVLSPAKFSRILTEFAQHRSHSSHSSHRSHSSHVSHYSGSTPSAPPETPAPTTPSVSTAPVKEKLNGDFSERSGVWRIGVLCKPAIFFDNRVLVTQSNGKVEIIPRTDASGSHYSGYVTKKRWDLTNGKVSVEVTEVTRESGEGIFALVADSDNWYRFSIRGNTLQFESSIRGVRSSAQLPYDRTLHRYWRFRHSSEAGTVLWETSDHGSSWTVRHAVSPDVPISSLSIELSAGTLEPASNPGRIIFDNFFAILSQ